MRPDVGLDWSRPVRVVVVSALVAAAIWAAWLGWDNTYYRVALEYPGDDGLRGPYTTAQVLGYAATVIVVAVIAAARWNSVLTGIGIFAGTWVPFTIWAIAVIGGSTVGVGIFLSLIGIGVGAALFSALGFAIGAQVRRVGRGRTTV